MDTNKIRDMIWDASQKAGLVRPEDTKEDFDANYDAGIADDPQQRAVANMFDHFGKLYTAEISGEYERRIEDLEVELREAGI